MIIDFHTHTFADKIAPKVIKNLSIFSNNRNYSDGTDSGLMTSMKEAGVDYSVVLPVATKPTQSSMLNEITVEKNQIFDETHLYYFGTVHPDNEDYKAQIDFLASHGVKGLKIHPVFSGVPIDDERHKKIIAYASEKNLAVVTHAGFDVGYPGDDKVSVSRIINVIDEIKPTKLILAHTGGWAQWEQVLSELCGADVWFDTSYSLLPIVESEYERDENSPAKIVHAPADVLSKELFVKIVRKHGADKILFGTDSPWAPADKVIEAVRNSGLATDEVEMILSLNAKKFLEVK